ncbi:MAG: ABC transporter ATP-binding protein [Candidatus Sumerlaeia bacterium]|nr:ABC transporter ATP-binding protein [Candidatus Sumerlaeia bacterium]
MADTPSTPAPGHAASLSARGVRLAFPNGTLALDALHIDVAPHEFVAVVGPSGCGKSTFLRLAAGLLEPTAGEILVSGEPPRRARETKRDIAFVFQSPTLLPWRTVEQNVRLPLELGPRRRGAAAESVADTLALVGLADFAGAYPRELSGGMKMRASLARALATRPDLMLLDEPFAALDDLTRLQLQEDLLRLRARDRWTAALVTHNVSEAVFLADRVLVMSGRPGRVAAELPVPFAHPRGAELRADGAFARLAGDVSRALREATNKKLDE